VQFLSGFIV